MLSNNDDADHSRMMARKMGYEPINGYAILTARSMRWSRRHRLSASSEMAAISSGQGLSVREMPAIVNRVRQ